LFVQEDLGLNRHEAEFVVDGAHPRVLVVPASPNPERGSMLAGGEQGGDLDGCAKALPSVLG
jgi:hypothetical protein